MTEQQNQAYNPQFQWQEFNPNWQVNYAWPQFQQYQNPNNFVNPWYQEPQVDFNNFGKKSKNLKNLDNEPSNSSGGQIIWKTFIGLLVWSVISALLFVILMFTSSIFSDALQSNDFVNPLLPWLLLFIWFLSTFIWNIIIAWLYNLFFAKKYYNFGKMAGFLLLTNAILLLMFFPLYLIFYWDIIWLFQLLWFHIIFSIFISANQIEFLSNPNYSWSALMWNVLGLSVSFLLYFIIQNFFSWVQATWKTYLMMLLPAIVGFSIIPLFAWIREKIYYRFYSMWSNAFYIPSISEVVNSENLMSKNNKKEDEQEDDEINVEMN